MFNRMIKSRLNFIKPIDNKHLKEVGDYKWIYKSFHSGDRVAGHEYIIYIIIYII